MKLNFEIERTDHDQKELRSLVDRVRKRFKVAVSPATAGEGDASTIVVAALGRTQNQLTGILDAIIDFCEDSGFGRVSSEQTLMDHVDAIADPESDTYEEE